MAIDKSDIEHLPVLEGFEGSLTPVEIAEFKDNEGVRCLYVFGIMGSPDKDYGFVVGNERTIPERTGRGYEILSSSTIDEYVSRYIF
jgi:hypothetical protein